VTEEF